MTDSKGQCPHRLAAHRALAGHDYTRALAHLRAHLATHADDVEAWLELGLTCHITGDREALAAIEAHLAETLGVDMGRVTHGAGGLLTTYRRHVARVASAAALWSVASVPVILVACDRNAEPSHAAAPESTTDQQDTAHRDLPALAENTGRDEQTATGGAEARQAETTRDTIAAAPADEGLEAREPSEVHDIRDVEEPARSPTVSLGSMEILGSLDKRIVRKVLQQHQKELLRCYQRLLGENAEATGHIVVKWTIGTDGGVKVVSIAETSLNDADAEACVGRAIEGWRYPQPKYAGGLVIVKTKLDFRQRGSDAADQNR